LAEEGSPLLSRTKKEATHLDLFGKKEGETENWEKENSQAQHMRDYKSSLLSRSTPQEAVLEHWKRGVTSPLGPRNCEESAEI
jgi:hypothetical protein